MSNKAFVFEVRAPVKDAVKATMNSVDWVNLWGGSTTGDLDEHGAYQAVAWVRRCLELRCNALSTIPVHVYSGETEVEWEFANLVPRLLWMTEASLQMYGAAYWIRERNRVKDKSFRWALPSTMTPKYDPFGTVLRFERKVSGRAEVQQFTLEEVLYFWSPVLNREVGPGTGWVSTALVESGVTFNANRFAEAFFERGAIPAVILSVEGNPSTEALKDLREWWKRLLGGNKHAWETVAVKGTVKPQVIGFPTKDLAMPELMQAMRQQICTAAAVPQTMLEDAANFATAAEHHKTFYSETIVPEARQIAATLNEQLFDPQGLRIVLDHEELDIFQDDEGERAASLQQLVLAGIPVDVAGEMLGLELPGEMTWDQFRERKKQDADEAAARAPKFIPGQQGEEGQRGEVPEELKQWRRYASKRTGEEAARFTCKVLQDDLAEVIRHRLVLAESPEEVKAAFSGPFLISTKATRVTAGGLEDPLSAPKNVAERELRKLLEERLNGQLDKIVRLLGNPPDITRLDSAFWDSEQGQMLAVVRPEIQKLAVEAAQYEMDTARLGVDWTLVAEEAVSFAERHSYDLVREINDTTREALQRHVPAYFQEQGRTLGDLRNDLEPFFGRTRAERIAVTEVTRAAAEGERAAVAVAERVGYHMVPIWHTNNDELVCEICAPLDGTETTEMPPAHPNCRCWITHDVKMPEEAGVIEEPEPIRLVFDPGGEDQKAEANQYGFDQFVPLDDQARNVATGAVEELRAALPSGISQKAVPTEFVGISTKDAWQPDVLAFSAGSGDTHGGRVAISEAFTQGGLYIPRDMGGRPGVLAHEMGHKLDKMLTPEESAAWSDHWHEMQAAMKGDRGAYTAWKESGYSPDKEPINKYFVGYQSLERWPEDVAEAWRVYVGLGDVRYKDPWTMNMIETLARRAGWL